MSDTERPTPGSEDRFHVHDLARVVAVVGCPEHLCAYDGRLGMVVGWSQHYVTQDVPPGSPRLLLDDDTYATVPAEHLMRVARCGEDEGGRLVALRQLQARRKAREQAARKAREQAAAVARNRREWERHLLRQRWAGRARTVGIGIVLLAGAASGGVLVAALLDALTRGVGW